MHTVVMEFCYPPNPLYCHARCARSLFLVAIKGLLTVRCYLFSGLATRVDHFVPNALLASIEVSTRDLSA